MMPQKNNGKKLHMIGNAHLDPVWLWPWQEASRRRKRPSVPRSTE